jgi:hypothetical protein
VWDKGRSTGRVIRVWVGGVRVEGMQEEGEGEEMSMMVASIECSSQWVVKDGERSHKRG